MNWAFYHYYTTAKIKPDCIHEAMMKNTFCRGENLVINIKSSLATYLTSNAKSLACDTANEHALERHAAACWQLSNEINGDDLSVRVATVENTIA